MASEAQRVAVVVEDDVDLRNLLEAVLGQAGFVSYLAADGAEGIEAVRTHQPILITLDISLPGIDGFEVARRIRSFSDAYIIVLSARDEEIDTLMGLDAGADDYLTKPFRPRELRARIEAMLRRYHRRPAAAAVATGLDGPAPDPDPSTPRSPADGAAPSPTPVTPVANGSPIGAPAGEDADDDSGWLQHKDLRINPDMWLCDLDGAPVELTRSEFDLLLAIMRGRRRVISKDTLALELRGDYVAGGYVSDADRRAVEVHVANLRRKLNDPVSSPRYVETVRGVGYRLAGGRS